jgi:hypothetical protein
MTADKSETKVITPDFGNRSNELFHLGVSVQLLYADEYVWVTRQVLTASSGGRSVKHQIIELNPEK